MTEAEAIENIALYGGNAAMSFTIYITFTFGFLAAAFFVGSDLTRFQAIAAVGLYTTAGGGAVISMVTYIQGAGAIMNNTPTFLDMLPLYNMGLWMYVLSAISMAGTLISLYFMWGVRHPKNE